jgi:hypothetical protein
VQQSSTPEVVYHVNDSLRSPYVTQTGVSVERQLAKYANLSVTYLDSRGVHQFYTNATPPPPTTALPPGTTPLIIYQYQSGGTFKQKQLIVNSRVQMGANLMLSAYYTLNYANSNTSGAGYVPSIPCGDAVPAGTPCGINEDFSQRTFLPDGPGQRRRKTRSIFGGTAIIQTRINNRTCWLQKRLQIGADEFRIGSHLAEHATQGTGQFLLVRKVSVMSPRLARVSPQSLSWIQFR